MKKTTIYFLLIIGSIFIFCSCGPKISKTLTTNYSALDYREKVVILGLSDEMPQGEILGEVKSGDTGFSTKCSYERVLSRLEDEARKAGGNVLKITKHKTPDFWSSCHRTTATILKVDDVSSIQKEENILPEDADYALLHIYRYSGTGMIINYDLHLGDSVICSVKNRTKLTLKIDKKGPNILWAKTETKKEIPIDIEMGKEYYIRCSVSMGIIMGRPEIEIVDNQTGKAEFNSMIVK